MKKNKKAKSTGAKQAKETPTKKADWQAKMATLRLWLKEEKSTVVVLAIAALAFVLSFARIHSEDFLHGAGEIFNVYGDEEVEFDTATVNEVLREEAAPDEVVTDSSVGSQELLVTVTSGRYVGQQMKAYNYFGALGGIPVRVKDSVTLTIKTHADGELSATVYEFFRIPALTFFLLVFIAATFAIGRLTGLKSLFGLLFTGVCLFTILVPLLIKGAPAVPTTFAVCSYVALVCFVVLGGVHRKSMCAFLGTVAGMSLSMLFGLAMQWFARIDGLRLDDAESLYQLGYYEGIMIDIRGLLVASIIICSLGAVMDVAMSISSALEEIHVANPALTQRELFESGMNLGRDMAGTMTNTLILAFAGGEFSLMVYIYARNDTFYHFISTGFIAIEAISGLSSSIGMILAIPLTAIISSTLITRAWLD